MRTDLTPYRAAGLSRQSRTTNRQINAARSDGVTAAARIEAASFCTHVALHHAAMLSSLEGELIQRTPLGERRYEAIANAFAATACAEISALSLRRS